MATRALAIAEPDAEPTRRRLLALLADGRNRSGAELGAELGVSRSAVWKQVRSLRQLGVEINAERRRGYRLGSPLDLLSPQAIRSGLDPATRVALESLEVLLVTESTSQRLMTMPAPAAGRLLACLAEYQTGGRGRRGRRWLSPLGAGICLSVSWCCEVAPRDLAALGLAVGVAVLGALRTVGAGDVSLKWPNDLVAPVGGTNGKLGGILVDVAGESGGPLKAVVGIGLNVKSGPALESALLGESSAAPPVALEDLVATPPVSRNQLVACLLNGLHECLSRFSADGFAAFAATWRRHDSLLGQPVEVRSGTSAIIGIARGIADDGALLVETSGQIVPVLAGDVTLRKSP